VLIVENWSLEPQCDPFRQAGSVKIYSSTTNTKDTQLQEPFSTSCTLVSFVVIALARRRKRPGMR